MVTVLRGDKEIPFKVKLGADKKLGLAPIDFDKMETLGWLTTETRKYGFFESFPAGIKRTFDKLGDVNMDPETGNGNGSWYPIQRIYNFGVNVTF